MFYNIFVNKYLKNVTKRYIINNINKFTLYFMQINKERGKNIQKL